MCTSTEVNSAIGSLHLFRVIRTKPLSTLLTIRFLNTRPVLIRQSRQHYFSEEPRSRSMRASSIASIFKHLRAKGGRLLHPHVNHYVVW